MKKLLIVMGCIFVFCCGCGSSSTDASVSSVTQDEVISLLEEGAILIDVRTENEYESGHISDAINIPVEEIQETDDYLTYENSDIGKDAKVIVYCQSGGRSSIAAEKLIELGYSNVYDFGSVENWSD